MMKIMSKLPKNLILTLACPLCKDRPKVIQSEDEKFIECHKCNQKFPITDGKIPQLLSEEAQPLKK